MPAAATFLVARNPDPESKLPYLLRLPIDGGIELKAREPWPATARVYCHPVADWPDGAAIVEEVPIRPCARRGRAIDLTLDCASQCVFTEPHAGRAGRPMIFWQTARTVRRRARPGQRVPTRRASGPAMLTIDVDSRERYPYRFADRAIERRRSALPCGDYAVRGEGGLLAAVERKTLEDLVKSLVDGSLAFAMANSPRCRAPS